MSRHQITLEWKEGRREGIEVRRDQTVLEAARSREIILPAGCLTGTCGTCTALILEVSGDGSVEGPEAVFDYRRTPRALRDEHRRQGFVLLCIAEPRADCRLAVGAASWSRRSESPWQ